MTTVSSNFELEYQLDRMVEVAKDFNQKHKGMSFSIEYSGHGGCHFVFLNQHLKKETAEYLDELCERHGVQYSVTPLDGRLAITLY